MQKARDWLLECDCLHPVEQIRMAQLQCAATSSDFACLDEGRMHLLTVG